MPTQCISCEEEAMPGRPECPRCAVRRVQERDGQSPAWERWRRMVELERSMRRQLGLEQVERSWS